MHISTQQEVKSLSVSNDLISSAVDDIYELFDDVEDIITVNCVSYVD